MKKKIFMLSLILILMCIVYIIYVKVTFNRLIDNTINYKDKINYNSVITLNMNNNITSSKIKYEVIKSSKVKKILLSNYKDKKLENKIERYILKKDEKEDFNINYNYLKKSKIKSYSNNQYVIKIKAKDAYNMIYNKKIIYDKYLNKYILLKIKEDKKNNFIKEISYSIDNLDNNKKNPLKYSVKIINTNINNHDIIDYEK